MSHHISKRLTEAQSVAILTQYQSGTIRASEAQSKLGLRRSQFFDLVTRFRREGSSFTLVAFSDHAHRRISKKAEEYIERELKEERKLIEDRTIPIRSYNYSAVRDVLKEKYDIEVSVPTIIDRAKDLGCIPYSDT